MGDLLKRIKSPVGVPNFGSPKQKKPPTGFPQIRAALPPKEIIPIVLKIFSFIEYILIIILFIMM